MKNGFVFIVLFSLVLGGCKKQPGGRIASTPVVLAADPYASLMRQEVEQYMSLYPQEKMEVRGSTAREAIVELLNDSVHCVAVDRPLNDEERDVARRAGIRIVENRFAEDGIAIIVHRQNGLTTCKPEFAQKIVAGEWTDWNSVPGSRMEGTVDLVLTGRNSGIYEVLQKKILFSAKTVHMTTAVNSQQDLVRYVASHPQAVGFVAASSVTSGEPGVKVLPVIARNPDGQEQSFFPGQQEVFDSLYPFHYSLYLYHTEAGAETGLGFSAFLLSNVGQKIIQRAGLVPAAIPYRTIQLNAE